MSEAEIRRAGPDDADQVGTLAERVYRHGGWADERYSKLLLDVPSRIEEATVFVAVADGVIVGTVTLGRPGTRFANMARAGEAEVRMLAVDEAARGQGIASLLMDACEGLARDEGFTALVLSTEPDMAAAHRLYRRRGYVRQPERDWRVGRSLLEVYRLSLAGVRLGGWGGQSKMGSRVRERFSSKKPSMPEMSSTPSHSRPAASPRGIGDMTGPNTDMPPTEMTGVPTSYPTRLMPSACEARSAAS
jgi:ribosomal protein S18 acetylase RimI-like enzyme